MPQLDPVEQILSPAESEAYSFPGKEKWPLTGWREGPWTHGSPNRSKWAAGVCGGRGRLEIGSS